MRALAVAVLLTLAPAAAALADNPWPAIRKERIHTLLPGAMERAAVDAWLVLCRENANDPMAMHVGGENAGGLVGFLFLRKGDAVEALAFSPPGEAVALRDVGLHDRVDVLEKGQTAYDAVAAALKRADPRRIAVNSGATVLADGLSWTQRRELEKALGPELSGRLLPAEDLVAEWLSVKLPAEVAILREAAVLTAQLEIEAYKTVVPGKTRDSDVGRFLKKRMAELGVADSWNPDQNPNVNSGPDRGHSNATDRVIQPGDFIQTDFGIKLHGVWSTDIQRFAYVLKAGETTAPPEAVKRWENSRKGSRTALAAMKPGVRGYDVDKAQRDWMKAAGSEWVMWGTGHPVGYWAHDAGPALSGGQWDKEPSGNQLRRLAPGQTFAFDGFFCWKLPEGGTKTLSVEEMAVVTATGAEYLIPPQEDLVLIR